MSDKTHPTAAGENLLYTIISPIIIPPFDPTTLFAGGQTGGWWDVSDHSTTFQDTAGTTPANTAGQIVKRVNDKSGNGNFISSSVGATLHNSGGLWWLQFDGATQFLTAAFTCVQPMTRITPLQQITWVNANRIMDGGSALGATFYDGGPSPGVQMYAGATLGTNMDLTLGVNHVALEVWNGASSSIQIDNLTAVSGNAGTSAPAGITIGATGGGGTFSNIEWFGGISIGRLLTTTETNNCRTFFGSKAGLTL
jgi:hypothetical protein